MGACRILGERYTSKAVVLIDMVLIYDPGITPGFENPNIGIAHRISPANTRTGKPKQFSSDNGISARGGTPSPNRSYRIKACDRRLVIYRSDRMG